ARSRERASNEVVKRVDTIHPTLTSTTTYAGVSAKPLDSRSYSTTAKFGHQCFPHPRPRTPLSTASASTTSASLPPRCRNMLCKQEEAGEGGKGNRVDACCSTSLFSCTVTTDRLQ
ncbi:unnamed protein product, partial [Ectocarpus sp. 6 AP-2014]